MSQDSLTAEPRLNSSSEKSLWIRMFGGYIGTHWGVMITESVFKKKPIFYSSFSLNTAN